MNGLEVAREIAATAPRIRMIMFTANDCEQLIKEAESAGIRKGGGKVGGQHSSSSPDRDQRPVPRTRCRIERGATSPDFWSALDTVPCRQSETGYVAV